MGNILKFATTAAKTAKKAKLITKAKKAIEGAEAVKTVNELDPNYDMEGAKKVMEIFRQKDPFFDALSEPITRDGPYGPELFYGVRRSTPWQLTMAKDMVQRLNNMSFNTKQPIPIRDRGNLILRIPEEFIMEQASLPVDMILSEHMSGIGGYSNADGRIVVKLRLNSKPVGVKSTLLHEGLMHGTDPLLETSELESIRNLYKETAALVNKLEDAAKQAKRSNKWYELRATLGELKTAFYKAIANSKGQAFYDTAEITPELKQQFETAIDRLDAPTLATALSHTNTYGADYGTILMNEYNGGGQGNITTILDRFKMLLKYAPTVFIGGSAATYGNPFNEESENNPSFYAQGGDIKIKSKNKGKFTKSAKAAGHTVQQHATAVLNDPNATPLQKKRANFARNAAKWHH